jgi:hypothetical protein
MRLSVTLAAAVCSLWIAGCGEVTQTEPVGEGAEEAVGQFIDAVLEGDAEACDQMTARARRQTRITGEERTCEEAIQAKDRFIAYNFSPKSSGEVKEASEAGKLVVGPTNTSYVFCMPNEDKIGIRLVQEGGTWLVDALSKGSTFTVDKDGERQRSPCRPG